MAGVNSTTRISQAMNAPPMMVRYSMSGLGVSGWDEQCHRKLLEQRRRWNREPVRSAFRLELRAGENVAEGAVMLAARQRHPRVVPHRSAEWGRRCRRNQA